MKFKASPEEIRGWLFFNYPVLTVNLTMSGWDMKHMHLNAQRPNPGFFDALIHFWSLVRCLPALRSFSGGGWLVVNFLLAMETALSAQPASTNPPPSAIHQPSTGFAGPRIQFASTTFMFGRVPSGERIFHDFVFTNTGQSVLEIRDVRPTCGCTIARASERAIQPGKTGIIPVQLDTSEFVGTIYKTVIVLCNDPATNSVTLMLTGTGWKPFEITPQFAGFVASSDVETNETRVLRITNNMDEALTLSNPVCTNDAFQCALKTITPGREFELDVTFLHSRALAAAGIAEHPITAATQTLASIFVNSSSPKFDHLAINAMGTIQPAVLVMPAQIRLPVNGLASGAQLSVVVRNYGAKPLTLSEPSVNVQGASVQARESLPGRVFMLNINFPNGSRCPPGQTAEIRLKTNHPQYSILRIPVIEDSPPSARSHG